jgi:hypothetical protein
MCSKAGGRRITKTNYVTISGQCNMKGMTPISFAAPDGKKGRFKGSIICDVIK